MANIHSLSLFRKARKGLSNLLFDDDEEDSPLRSIKADPVNTDEGDPAEVDSEVRSARQGYLQSLQDSKISDINRFFVDEPEEPEFDRERNKKLQNLSKVNAIAAFVDALSQAIPRARSDASDRPTTVTPRSNNLGMNALEMLQRQDLAYQRQMDQFMERMRNTKRTNKQMELQAEQQNRGVETDVAATELEFARNDAALKAAQEEIKLNEQKNDEEAWEELAFRLASNGQPEAAVQAMVSSGKSEEEATSIVEKMRKQKGDGSGDSKDFEITPQMKNMAKRYKKLQDQIDDGGSGMTHYGPDGTPLTATAREAEKIREMLGENMYADEIMQILEGTTGDGGGSGEQLLSPANRQAAQQGLDPDAVRQGLNSPESIASENRALVEKVRNASNEQEARNALGQWVQRMRDQGFSEPEIKQGYQKLLGIEPDTQTAQTEGQEDSQPQEGAGAPGQRQMSGEQRQQSGKSMSADDLDDVLAKIELEMARGEPGSFGREITDRLWQLLIGTDTQGRRFQHSLADILKSPITEGYPLIREHLKRQQEQAEERRKELLDRFINAQNNN